MIEILSRAGLASVQDLGPFTAVCATASALQAPWTTSRCGPATFCSATTRTPPAIEMPIDAAHTALRRRLRPSRSPAPMCGADIGRTRAAAMVARRTAPRRATFSASRAMHARGAPQLPRRVAGGIDVPLVLGSRSTQLRGDLRRPARPRRCNPATCCARARRPSLPPASTSSAPSRADIALAGRDTPADVSGRQRADRRANTTCFMISAAQELFWAQRLEDHARRATATAIASQATRLRCRSRRSRCVRTASCRA